MTHSIAEETVLFVDDEKNILNALKREMIDEGYQCLFASSGNQALQIMQKEKVSVIVSDMKMPEMDGLRLLKLVKEKYPSTVRIVLSGYTQLTQILLSINQAGIFKFLVKPWGDELKSVILEAVNYHQLMEDRAKIEKLLNVQTEEDADIISRIENIVLAAKSTRMMYSALGIKAIETAVQALDNPDNASGLHQQLMMASSMITEISKTEFEEYREIRVEAFCERLGRVLTDARLGTIQIECDMPQPAVVKTMPHILSRFVAAAIAAVTNYPDDFLIRLRPSSVTGGCKRFFELTCLISTDSYEMPEEGYEAQHAYIDMLNNYASKALSLMGGGFQGLIAKGVIIMKIVVSDEAAVN